MALEKLKAHKGSTFADAEAFETIKNPLNSCDGEDLEPVADDDLIPPDEPLVDGAHDAATALKQRNRCTYWCFLIAIANLYIPDRGKPAACINKHTEEFKQGWTGLLERQRYQGLTQGASWCIHIPELSRLDRHIIIPDSDAPRLKAAR